jgi:hypothetical protein
MAHMNKRYDNEEKRGTRPVKRQQYTDVEQAEAALNAYTRFAQKTHQTSPPEVVYEPPPSRSQYPQQDDPRSAGWYDPMALQQQQQPPPLDQKRVEAGGMSDLHQAQPVPQNFFIRNLLIAGLSVVLLLLTGIFIFLILNHFSNKAGPRDEDTRLSEHRPPLHHAEFLDGLQNMSVYYYPFITGPQTDVEQRFPPTGTLPSLDFSTLVDFNVCCTSLTERFVCMSGSAFNHGSVFLDAIIEYNSTTHDVYLLLWVNSKDLIEVACAVRGFYLVS